MKISIKSIMMGYAKILSTSVAIVTLSSFLVIKLISSSSDSPQYSTERNLGTGNRSMQPGLLQRLCCRLRRQGKREMRGHLALRKGARRPLDPRFTHFIPDCATALSMQQGFAVLAH